MFVNSMSLSIVVVVLAASLGCSEQPSGESRSSPTLPREVSPVAVPFPVPNVPMPPEPFSLDESESLTSGVSPSIRPIAIEEATPEPSEPELHEVDGLTLQRFALSRAVEGREPVDPSTMFSATNERLYAFVDGRNDSDIDREIVVTFERQGHIVTGDVFLMIPAHQPRWRTWAYSRYVTEPGSWAAIVRTPEGELLGRLEFEVTE